MLRASIAKTNMADEENILKKCKFYRIFLYLKKSKFYPKKSKFYPKRVNSIRNLYFLIAGRMCFSKVDIIHNSVSREEARVRCDYVISNDRRTSGTGNPLTKYIFSRKIMKLSKYFISRTKFIVDSKYVLIFAISFILLKI